MPGVPDSLALAGVHTSEELVRALKAAADPPAGLTLSKVELATLAWADAELHVPKKAHLLAEWALETLCRAVRDSSQPGAQAKGKAKAKSNPSAVLADAAVWQLLTDASATMSAAERAALAQKHSTLALVSATVRSSALHSLAVLRPASLAFKRLIPAAAARAQHNIDLIAEPITAVIAALPSFLSAYDEGQADQDCLAQNILIPLVRAWSSALEIGANSKKASKYCLSSVLAAAPGAWQALLSAQDARPRLVTLLRSSLRHFLAEALFTAERLAALLASASAMGDLFAALRSAAESSVEAASDVPALLPELLALLHGKLAQHRLALLPAAGPSADVSLAGATATQVAQERSATLHAFVEPAAELVEAIAGAHQASTRAALLSQIEELKLFVRASDDAATWKALLRRAGAAATADIGQAASGTQLSSTSASLRAITILLRLDDSLAKALLPAVLRKVASLPREDAAAQELLRTLADGAGARREVPELLTLLCQALQAAPMEHPDETLPALPVLRGAFFTEELRAQLASALSIFVAPSQVMDCLTTLRDYLKELATALTASDGGSATDLPSTSKRRKTASGTSKASSAAVSLSSASLILGLRMGALIVANLLLPAPMREEIFSEMRQLFDEVVTPILDRPRRRGHAADDAILAEALRLRLAMLSRATDATAGTEQATDDAAWLEAALDQRADHFVEWLQQEPAPELLLALSATLLQRASADCERRIVETPYTKMIGDAQQPLVQALLGACEADSVPDDQAWNGEVHGLSRGRESSAVWTSLAWDWLPTFERLAGSDVLELFSSSVIIPSLHTGAPTSGLACISALLARNASFLESHRWRAALMKEGERMAQGELTASAGGPLATQLALARFPTDYFPSTQQQTFAAHAARTDAQIASVARSLPTGTEASSAKQVTQALWAELRTWQARLAAATSTRQSGDQPSETSAAHLLDLVDPKKLPVQPSDALQSATLRLFDAHVRALVLRAQASPASAAEAGPWSSLLHVDAELAAGVRSVDSARSVQSVARVRLLELLLETAGGGATGASKNKQVPAHVLEVFAASSPCSPSAAAEMLAHTERALSSGDSATGLLDAAHGLRALAARLRLSQLAAPGTSEATQAVAVDVVRSLTRSSVLLPMLAALVHGADSSERQPASQTAAELLRLFAVCLRLFKESGEPAQAGQADSLDASMGPPCSMPDDLSTRVALTFSALLTVFEDQAVADSLRAQFADCSAAMTPSSYDAALNAVTNALAEPTAVGQGELAALLDTAGIILRHGPEGTLAIAQRHWSRLVGELHPLLREQPAVILPALRTIEQVCSGKAMLLRSPDVGQLFALLGALLGAREQPESFGAASQGPQIFAALVATLESVVRLRADLVSPLLPHLTALLSQLMALFPTLRAQIGTGHAAAVTSRLPAWLDIARTPLGPQEARALSRLLTSLNTKSVALPQTLQRKSKAAPGERSAKVTSLAKALSKHAPYVLAAHVRTLVHPSTHVSMTVRQELRAGLYALCDVTGTHERDALMLAHLDSGERAVLKSLWAEWEAQRYRGA